MNRPFRAAAIAEALSWAGLLVGTYLKWVVVSTPIVRGKRRDGGHGLLERAEGRAEDVVAVAS